MNIKQTLSILMLFMALAAMAEPVDSLPRPVTGVWQVEAGRASVLSTYLSPIRYTGSSFALSGEWSKALPASPEHLTMQFDGEVDMQDMLNPMHTARMIGAAASFDWHLFYRWNLHKGLQVSVGGGPQIEGGVFYLTRNGNNPVSANVAAQIDAAAKVSYLFRIKRLPVVATYQARVPSLGVFFSPQYGETYYEIYLGNHKGLAHCGWWGNRFGIDNMVSLDLGLGRTALRLGYRFDYQSQWACHLNTRKAVHYFVIGVIPGGLKLR